MTQSLWQHGLGCDRKRTGWWGSVSDSVIQLAKFLGMLGSNHDGEVLNAARIAERLRKKLDKSWVALLTGAPSELGAEARAFAAETRVRWLESRVAALERKIATTRTSGSSAGSQSRCSDRSPAHSALGQGIQLALRPQGATLAELRQLSSKILRDVDTLWWVMFKDCEQYGYRFWATKFRGDPSRVVYHLEHIF